MNEITQILDAMQARCDGATEGPWNCACNATFDQRWYGIGAPKADDGDDDLGRVVCITRARETGVNGLPNAQFIAHARTDTPNLIAALREAVKALEGLHEYWNRDPNEHAMHDACENTIEVADRTLATIAKLLKGEKP